jgi:predicted helicase
MFSHQYRERYNAYLVRNFARFPITRSRDLFEQLSKMGLELIEIHLMESTHFAGEDKAQYIGNNNPLVGKFVWKDEDVFVNFTGKRDLVQDHFTGVSRKVWDYVIGGYPVCQKWLNGRAGQRLTLEDRNHFLAIVSAISSTISISNEIDRVLSSEGGWPIQ